MSTQPIYVDEQPLALLVRDDTGSPAFLVPPVVRLNGREAGGRDSLKAIAALPASAAVPLPVIKVTRPEDAELIWRRVDRACAAAGVARQPHRLSQAYQRGWLADHQPAPLRIVCRDSGSSQGTSICMRCQREARPGPNWNAMIEGGVLIGALCHDCQTVEENSEAVINASTLTYGRAADGRLAGAPKIDIGGKMT